MRVAYVCADPGVPVFGHKGCSIHVQEVVRTLLRLGANIDLFATRIKGKTPTGLEAVRVHELPKGPKGFAGAERETASLASNQPLREHLDAHGPFDLIYERYSLWSYAAMEKAVDDRTCAILEVNAPLIEEQLRYRELVHKDEAEKVARRAFYNASALIAVSDEVASYLKQWPEAADRVHVAPNGVNPDRFPLDLSPMLPAAPDVFTVGFLGTLKPWHGLDVLIESFALLHERDPHVRLLVVGDGPERELITQDITCRGLRNAVEFTGAVTPDQVPGLLASMDVGVAPYHELEDFYFSPLKVFEYMAAGLAVVASDVGQIRQVIDQGVTGVLCPPGNAVGLADALVQLKDNPQQRLRMGMSARTYVARQHSWEKTVRRILDIAEVMDAT